MKIHTKIYQGVSIHTYMYIYTYGCFSMHTQTDSKNAPHTHRFDFFIVMITYAGSVIDMIGSAVGLNPTVLRVQRIFRIFRILRALRIFKTAKGLYAIASTLV